MRIVFVGPPGAGKGTQAQRLKDHLGVAHLSTGEMFREANDAGTELGKRAASYYLHGKLVPDEIVIELVKQRVKDPDCAAGFIIDGFPRTIPQAEALKRAGVALDFVVDIQVSDDEILRRMSGRRVHLASGRTYHVEFNPPRVPGKDDVTGEPLVQRADDNEETVRQRIAVYHALTKPLIEFYLRWRASDDPRAPLYVNIYGKGSVEHIRDKLFAALAAKPA